MDITAIDIDAQGSWPTHNEIWSCGTTSQQESHIPNFFHLNMFSVHEHINPSAYRITFMRYASFLLSLHLW